MVPVIDLARLGPIVVEDAAQAHGALDPGASAAVAYSFYPTKNLGGLGDGGMVVTDDAAIAESVRLERHHGMRELYVHESIGTSSRMSEVEAAVLRAALPGLAAENVRRREVARRYREAAPALRWHAPHPRHVCHLCVVRVPDRAAFGAGLPFQTGVHYPLAVTQQPAYRRFARHACPRAEAWAVECVTLPCFPEMTEEEVSLVCSALAGATTRTRA